MDNEFFSKPQLTPSKRKRKKKKEKVHLFHWLLCRLGKKSSRKSLAQWLKPISAQ